MRYLSIPEHENTFQRNLVDSSGKKFTITESIDLNGIQLHKIRHSNHRGFFYNEKTQKNMIVLHSTIGVLRGDIATLTNINSAVSVSYVVSRSGVVYELFDPELWAYHLGQGTIGGNKVNSSRSIGIELSNLGPLTNVNGNLETVYSRQKFTDAKGVVKVSAPDVYCTVDDINEYVKLDTPFRGYQYFTAYTKEQYIATNQLVRYLCSKFNIPVNYLDANSRFSPFNVSNSTTFSGICSHVNYRTSGKWDMSPDFNWDLVINDISIPSEKPKNDVRKPEPIQTKPEDRIFPIPPKRKTLFSAFLKRFS